VPFRRDDQLIALVTVILLLLSCLKFNRVSGSCNEDHVLLLFLIDILFLRCDVALQSEVCFFDIVFLWFEDFGIVVGVNIAFPIAEFHFLARLQWLRLFFLVFQQVFELFLHLLDYFDLVTSLNSHLSKSFFADICITRQVHLSPSRSVMPSSLNFLKYSRMKFSSRKS
jgi:hypothetical protein